MENRGSNPVSRVARRYLRAALEMAQPNPDSLVPTGVIARRVGVSKVATSIMQKKLATQGLAVYIQRRGMHLTERGIGVASQELRRYRLMNYWLSTVLGTTCGLAEADSMRLAEVVSDRLLRRIDDILGSPEFDLHGDPIPRSNGSVPKRCEIPLSVLSEGSRFRLVRVQDHDFALFNWLTESQLQIGNVARLVAHRQALDLCVLDVFGERVLLSRSVAGKLFVVPVPEYPVDLLLNS